MSTIRWTGSCAWMALLVGLMVVAGESDTRPKNLRKPPLDTSPSTTPAAPVAEKGKPNGTDQERIQGSWRVVRIEAEGSVRTRFGANGNWPRWVFRGNLWINMAECSKIHQCRFWLDPKRTPKHFEYMDDGSAAGLPGPVQVRGIYKQEGNRLWIRLGESAGGPPNDFRTTWGDTSTSVYVLEREESVALPAPSKKKAVIGDGLK